MLTKIIILSLAITAAVVSRSEASVTQWNINASSCVPDNSAIQANLYLNSAGTTGFTPGKSGDIVLYCPVPILPFSPSLLGAGIVDDTATAASHIQIQYIKIPVGSGSYNLIKSVTTAAASGTYQLIAGTFTDTYDPTNYAYYVRVDLVRAASPGTARETVFVVSLQQ